MMNSFIQKVKERPKIKNFILWLIVSKHNPKPRWWIRNFLTPFIHKKGKGSRIRKRTRIDIFPWYQFSLGKYSTIEDFATVSNGAGDLIIGDLVRIGIGSVVLGPAIIGTGCSIGQHAFVSGFNHCYQDVNINIKFQDLERKIVVIEEDTYIGANSVILAGVHIGKHCQIGAGSVGTKDIPDYSIAVGNPARVIKRYDFQQQEWTRITTT